MVKLFSLHQGIAAGRTRILEAYTDGTTRCYERQYENGMVVSEDKVFITPEMRTETWVFGYIYSESPMQTYQGLTLDEMCRFAGVTLVESPSS